MKYGSSTSGLTSLIFKSHIRPRDRQKQITKMWDPKKKEQKKEKKKKRKSKNEELNDPHVREA